MRSSQEILRAVAIGALVLAPVAQLIAQARQPSRVPRLDGTPALTIGSVDGDEHLLFSQISGAVRLSTGDIVIANSASNELRWFSATGKWIRSTGREGSGPGEFRGMRAPLRLRGDSVLVHDPFTMRVTLYDRTGQLARSWSVASPGNSVSPGPIGQTSDGAFITMTENSTTRPPGHLHFVANLIRYAAGAIRDTVARVPGGEGFSVVCGANNTGACNIGVPYGAKNVLAMSGDRIYIGNGERYEIFVVTPGRGVVDTISRTLPTVALTPQRLAYYRDSVLATAKPGRRDALNAQLVQAPVRATMPFFSAIVADDADRLWIARPQGIRETNRTWDVLSTSGAFLGSLQLPARLRVTHIANNHIVGITKDDDGVEFVQVLKLAAN